MISKDKNIYNHKNRIAIALILLVLGTVMFFTYSILTFFGMFLFLVALILLTMPSSKLNFVGYITPLLVLLAILYMDWIQYSCVSPPKEEWVNGAIYCLDFGPIMTYSFMALPVFYVIVYTSAILFIKKMNNNSILLLIIIAMVSAMCVALSNMSYYN